MTTGEDVVTEDVLVAVERGLAMGDFASHRSPTRTARYVIECLRALPVEQRMEAMGMRLVDVGGGDCEVWYREPFTPVPHDDARTYWTSP